MTAGVKAAPGLLLPGLLLAAAGAIGFSGKAIIVKLAYRHGVDPVTLIALRMVMALPLFLAMAWWAGRGQAPLTRRDWLGIVVMGTTGYYLSSLLDFLGLQYISASLERLILYLNPTLVMVLAWLVHRRPWTRPQLIGMLLSYMGVVLVFSRDLQSEASGNVVLGSALVFASAVSYAVYLLYAEPMVKRLGSIRLVGLATSVACVLCIVQYLALRPLSTVVEVAPQVLWLSLLNATLCTAVPVLLLMMAVERIGPALTAQTSLVGPISTILFGVWLLDEALTPWVVLGTLLVLAGIAVFSRR